MKVLREERYRRAWETPVRTLAKEFDISDVGLARICRKNLIPLQPVGHWAKALHGKGVLRPPLPESTTAEITFDAGRNRPKKLEPGPLASKLPPIKVALPESLEKLAPFTAARRKKIRQARTEPNADALHQWLLLQRSKVPNGSATANALDHSLKRWDAQRHYLYDGQLPIDNNWCANQIRPVASGRGNWLFAGSLRAGQRAAAVMSLIQSARINGHHPYACMKDILTRLPTQGNGQIEELPPHRWTPQIQ